MEKVELLAPVGDEEKLEYALKYGADAVYFGPALFSLRTSRDAFTIQNIPQVIEKVKSSGKRVYLTLNTMPTESLLKDVRDFARKLYETGSVPDAFILSDPGVLMALREIWRDQVEYHLSTQANCINSESAKFWYKNGIKRVILGRELTLEDIKDLKRNLEGTDIEIEVFIHGAMCMAYSGRCFLSNFFTGRNANRGECAHPCRWKYYLMEETRPGEYFPIEEYNTGTYLLNSHDLCVGEDIYKLIEAGVDSLKIEGRNKGTYYVAIVTGVYRKLIDLYYDKENFSKEKVSQLADQLTTVVHRPYSKGFLFGNPREETSFSKYLWEYRFLGFATTQTSSEILVEVRNQFEAGEELEIVDENINIYKVKPQRILKLEEKSEEEVRIAKNGWQVKLVVEKGLPSFKRVIVRKRWNQKLN